MNRQIGHICLLKAFPLIGLLLLSVHTHTQTILFSHPGETYNNTDSVTEDPYGPVDISNCSSIEISLDFNFSLPWEGSGNMETSDECGFSGNCPGDPTHPDTLDCSNCWDFLWVRFIIDGTEIGSDLIGDPETTNADQSGTISLPAYCTEGASDLVIEVYTQTWASDETVTFSNIEVLCWDDSPVADATPNPVCEGENLQLDETGGGDFSNWEWTGPNGFSASIKNPVINNITPADAGVYEVEVEDPNGCQIEDEITVTVDSAPTFTAIDLGDICNSQASAFDLTIYEDSITTEPGLSVTFYDGDPENGGSPIGDPSNTDLTALGSLWAEVDNGPCSASFSIPFNLVPAPEIDPVSDVTECAFYVLPEITGQNLSGNEAYYDQMNGGGNAYQEGDTIFSNNTIYAFDDIDGCTAEESFVITINPPPQIDPIDDVTSCSSYTLPDITGNDLAGNEMYWTESGQGGTGYNEGEIINSNTTLYASSGDPATNCYDEEPFDITILAEPDIDPVSDVSECSFYILPDITGQDLTGNEAYFDQMNGGGTTYQQGDTIFSSMTLYAFDDNGGCSDEESFAITIEPAPLIDPIDDVSACASYTLPNITGSDLAGNEMYWTESGQGGTGYNEGDVINTSTTLYASSGDPATNCYDEEPFAIDIFTPPDIDPVNDVSECGYYVLPEITGQDLSGNEAYFDQMNGGGTSYQEGDTIFSGTSLYAFDQNGPCSDEESFVINIQEVEDPSFSFDDFCLDEPNGPEDIQTPGGTFSFNPPPGGGVTIDPSTGEISGESPNTYFVQYITPGSCPDSTVVDVTVFALPDFTEVTTICNPGGATYDIEVESTGDDLGSTAGTVTNNGNGNFTVSDVPEGTTVTLTLSDSSTGCSNTFMPDAPDCDCPQIDPIDDVTACEEYVLPPIEGQDLPGNTAYYDAPDGGGSSYQPGDVIAMSTVLYAFYENSVCSDEETFDVTILQQPELDPVDDITACGSYTLPPIDGSNLDDPAYYSESGGMGNQFLPGEVIGMNTVLFVYDGTTGCEDELQFTITVLSRDDPFFIFEDFCEGAVNGPEEIETPGGTFSFHPPPGDGAVIDPVTGEIFNETINTYSVRYISPGICPDTSVVQVEVLEVPSFENISYECDPSGMTYMTLIESDGDALTTNMGSVVPEGNGAFTVIDIPAGSSATLNLINDNGCFTSFTTVAPDCDCPQIDPIDDLTACAYYILPPIEGMNLPGSEAYYTGSGGSGMEYLPGDTINNSSTLYAWYSDGNCEDETSFDLTVFTEPEINMPDTITGCDEIVLPEIDRIPASADASYYTQAGGSGTEYLPGDTVDTEMWLYLFAGSGACSSEDSLFLQLGTAPNIIFPGDVHRCGFYIFPPIIGSPVAGNEMYYSGSMGTGTSFEAGDTITSSGTYYIYGGVPGCSDEVSFQVTINAQTDIYSPGDLAACDSVLLPPIDGTELQGNEAYYTAPGGGGMMYQAGDVIYTSTTLYLYGGSDACEDEEMIEITISGTPDITAPNAISSCAFSVLPPITGNPLFGNEAYYTEPGGQGTAYAAGDTLFASDTLYIYGGAPGCSDEETLIINVYPEPMLEAVSDTVVCGPFELPEIQGMHLTGNEGYFTEPNGQGIQYFPGDLIQEDTTLYIYDERNGCLDEHVFQITVHEIPMPQPLYNYPVCVGDELSLFSDVDGGWTFYWGGPNGYVAAGDQPLVIDSATLDWSGPYWVYADNGYCLSDTVYFGVTILDLFDYPLNDTTLCDANSPVDLNALYNLPDTIGTWSGTGVSDGMLDVSFPFSDTLELFAPGYCQNSHNVVLQLHSKPERTERISDTLCAGDSLLIHGQYFGEHHAEDTLVLPGTAVFGCDSIIEIDLHILHPDTLILDQMLCTGDSLTVNGTVYDALNPSGIQILENQAVNGCDSVLLVDLTFVDAITEQISDTICPGDSLVINGTAYHQGNLIGQEFIPGGSQAGCDSIIEVNLEVYPVDTTVLDQTLCTGDFITVNGTVYDSSRPTGMEILEGQAMHGCDSIVLVDLTFDSLQVSYRGKAPDCESPDFGSLVITEVSTGSFDFMLEGVDSLSDQTAPLTIDALAPGSYRAVITGATGSCREEISFDIPAFEPLSLSLGPDLEVQEGATVTLNASVNFDPLQLLWSPGSLTSCDTCRQISIQALDDMTVSVTAIAGEGPGCTVSDTLRIRVVSSRKVYIPNAFSPNDDGINDVFRIYTGGRVQEVVSMRIFNRWGDLVFEDYRFSPEPTSGGWDGRFRGQKLNPGVFIYLIEVAFHDGSTRLFKGEVTLIR